MLRLPYLLASLLVSGQSAPAPSAPSVPFTLSSSSVRDGAVLPRRFAGALAKNPNCVGENVSPQLSWSNAPAGTKSIAMLFYDPEGRSGLGVAHWVAYGIPMSRTAFAEGEISRPPNGFTGGRNQQTRNYYIGPCTPPNTQDHHYIFIAIATDLEPDALPPDLTREALLERLKGHAKASAGLVVRFRHP